MSVSAAAGTTSRVLVREAEPAKPPVPGARTPTPAPTATDLLDLVMQVGVAEDAERAVHPLSYLGPLVSDADASPEARRQLIHLLGETISRIDSILSRQINRIIHHPKFQKLEASWRGLLYLIDQSDPGEGVKVRMLNVSWAELARDAERALEFDANALFQKVYEEEFGSPGGEPFGVLIGDYEIHPQLSAAHPVDDIAALTSISQVAAAAFAPFITSAHPSLLGLTSFGDLERPIDLARAYDSPEYIRWRAFRQTEEARFVGLTLPRILMRLPYHDDQPMDKTPFAFREEVSAPAAADYLWGNAAYAFGAVLVRTYSQSRWLMDIRGVRRGEEGAGIVAGLPVHSFSTDVDGVAQKFSTDVAITDQLDRTIGDLGLIPLCPCKDTEYSAFYSNRSLQEPKVYSEVAATVNAKISSMLQYVLCAARIAHYLKVIGRDRIGSFIEPAELRNLLSNWLNKYTVDDTNASADVKSRFPLRKAQVNVREHPGKPGTGSYLCEMLLLPHSQSDELALGIKLVTELVAARTH